MTLPAYSGRHATFDATTVLPVVPPAGAPPGPPSTVRLAFAVVWAQGIPGALAVGFWTLMAVAFGLGTGEYVGLLACLVFSLVGFAAVGGWFLLANRVRRGGRAARIVVVAGNALVLALGVTTLVITGTTADPTFSLVLLAVVLSTIVVPVLLFLPASNAWFRAVSPAPGPGSPPR